MERKSLSIKDSSLSFILAFLLSQLGVIVAMCVTMIAYRISNSNLNNFEIFLNSASGYLISSLALYLIITCVFIFFNRKKENQITQPVKLKKFLMYVLIAISSFLCLYPIVVCFDSMLIKCGISLSSIPYSLTTKSYFISLISLVIAPAICEELLFRGLIFKGLKKHGKSFAIIISSLMFSLFHMSISQTIYPILMGLLLSVIMFYENNIYYCIAVHLTNNFLSLTLSYFKINLIFKHWTYVLLAIILFVIFVAVVSYFIFKNKNKNKDNKTALTKLDKVYLFSSLGFMLLIWIFINLL